MTVSQMDLAALMCSRLCHDLLSPVGALNNGLELLEDETDPDMRKRCIDLLGASARTTAQKLKYFRLAFGSAGGYGEHVNAEEPKELIAGIIAENDRVTMEWVSNDNQLPKMAVKVLLNLALIAIDSLVRGGNITVAIENTGTHCEIALRATGPKIVADDVILRALKGRMDDGELSARTVAAYMVEELVRYSGGEVQIVREADVFILGAAVKN